MHSWREVAFILCIAVVIAAVCSHLTVKLLKIKASWGGYQPYGATDEKASTILYGSSVAYSGVDWHKVAEELGGAIVSWASVGSTPSEWEHMQHRAVDENRSIIAVSAVDMNEYALCDFRSEIVPLSQTVADLWQMKADRHYWKRVLSQYPLSTLRNVFPTIGRSDGVMTGIRDGLEKITHRGSGVAAGEAFRIGPGGNMAQVERVTDWEPGRLQRRMVLMRAACEGKQSFDGLKKMALMRLFQKAHQQGEVIWVVLPVSPFYQAEFLTPTVRQELERTLLDIQRSWPEAKLIRLDDLRPLQDNAMYTDFVHLNRDGQKIATAAFLEKLGKETGKQ